ncbi:hypothetical protein SNEBB_006994 [Seison nebaliae]|nr:hypothetical protein SNEBB_006994 [Seison nebaliae]
MRNIINYLFTPNHHSNDRYHRRLQRRIQIDNERQKYRSEDEISNDDLGKMKKLKKKKRKESFILENNETNSETDNGNNHSSSTIIESDNNEDLSSSFSSYDSYKDEDDENENSVLISNSNHSNRFHPLPKILDKSSISSSNCLPTQCRMFMIILRYFFRSLKTKALSYLITFIVILFLIVNITQQRLSNSSLYLQELHEDNSKSKHSNLFNFGQQLDSDSENDNNNIVASFELLQSLFESRKGDTNKIPLGIVDNKTLLNISATDQENQFVDDDNENEIENDIVFVTYFNRFHSYEKQVLLSKKKFFPKKKLIIFDIHLSFSVIGKIQSMCNETCEIIPFQFSKFPSFVQHRTFQAFKPIAIQMALQLYNRIFWFEYPLIFDCIKGPERQRREKKNMKLVKQIKRMKNHSYDQYHQRPNNKILAKIYLENVKNGDLRTDRLLIRNYLKEILFQHTYSKRHITTWSNEDDAITKYTHQSIFLHLTDIQTFRSLNHLAQSFSTLKKLLNYFHFNSNELRRMKSFDTYKFIYWIDTRLLLLDNDEWNRSLIMLPWLQCTLNKTCLAPPETQAGGCSNLRKPVYLYVGCHKYSSSILNVVLSQAFRLPSRNTYSLKLNDFSKNIFQVYSKTVDY